MNWGVVVFPGSNCDLDAYHLLKDVLGEPVRYVWHAETSLAGLDAVILPGGFSYGDYLRTGAIARFAPVMGAVERFAREGGLVLGICNGFQILCEAGLLPGALLRNNHLQFRCGPVHIRVENNALPFTAAACHGRVLTMPIAHGDGNYYADPVTHARLREAGRIVFRYTDAAGRITAGANPNGALDNIAGVCNEAGNVLGMMPHPERAGEELLGSADGLVIFQSMILRGAAAPGGARP